MRIAFGILIFICSCKSEIQHDRKNIFRYNEETGIATLDPAFSRDQSIIWAVTQLYDGLLELDSNLQIQPCLAKDWDTLDNGFRYRFYLRTDVRFHDDACFPSGKGRKMYASDILFTYQRLTSKELGSPGSWIFNGKIDTIQPFTVVNDSVFDIRLSCPYRPFLNMLAMPYAFIMAKEAVQLYGKDVRRHPVGTGPFILQYWEEGIRMYLRKNQSYFQSGLPYLDGIDITFKESKQVAFFEFIQGNLDMMNGIESSFKDELLTRQGKLTNTYRDQYQLFVEPYLNTEYLGIQTQLPGPLADARVRKAISLSINREEMIKFLRNGLGETKVNGMIPKGIKGYTPPSSPTFDPSRAKALLKEAGYDEKNPLPEITLYTTKNYVDLSIYMQDQLAKNGIRITLEVNPGPLHRQKISRGELALFRASWIADYPDPENYLNLFLSENHPPNGPNYTFFQEKEYEVLFKKYMEGNPKHFIEPAQLSDFIMESQPVIILFYDQSLRLVNKKWNGIKQDAMNRLLLKYTYLNRH